MTLVRCALLLLASALCAQEPIDYSYSQIYSGQDGHRFQPTVREECRSIIFGSDKTVYTVGVQSNKTDKLQVCSSY